MKKWFVGILLILVCASCARKRDFFNIVRDCTGTYLRKDNVDWKVCNPQKLNLFFTGQQVKVYYNPVENCDNNNPVDSTCLLFHDFQGNIEIVSVE